MNARELALMMLLEVAEEKKLCHTVISKSLAGVPDMEKRERAFAGTLCTGCIEHLLTLDYLIMQYSSVPIKKMKPVIRNILRMGFYQLWYMQAPPSAVCNEAVKLTKKRGLSGLSGFVNGVLRNAARKPVDVFALTNTMTAEKKLSIRYSIPEWLTERFLTWYGADAAEKMFESFLKKTDLSVRVNISKISAEECRQQLVKEGITVQAGIYVKNALHLSGIDSVERLKAFQNGLIQVQDESSMLAVVCAGLKAGSRVIDCCAAPGGKALQAADLLLEAGKSAKTEGIVSARDISEYKLQKIRENVQRAGFSNIEVLSANALTLRVEDIETADAVIADLPCSGLGIIGRKPDIKYNVTPEGLKELKSLQQNILRIATQYVKPGGTLIYSTCTINREENEENAAWIKETLGLVPESLDKYLPETLHSKTTSKGWLQMLPEAGRADGFFISRFCKPEK